MKKDYVKPQAQIVEVENNNILCASNVNTTK